VLVAYDKQSNDIAQGVDHASDDHLNTGAGDQGLMFGYACDETTELMPALILRAPPGQRRRSQEGRRMPYLRPDAKSQVTMRYVDGKLHSIDTVVLSSQHDPSQSETPTKMKGSFIEAVIEEIIKLLLKEWLKNTLPDKPDRALRYRRAGATAASRAGRSSSTPTAAPARRRRFSGGPSKVDRSAAYAALRRQEHRRCRHRAPVPDPGRLRDRRRQADERHRLYRRHG
jgi:S-adenosylmethionine synthetase